MRAATTCMLSLLLGLVHLSAQVPGPRPGVNGRLEIFHLGNGRQLSGYVLKTVEQAIFVDIGFDILRLPLASVVRREVAGEVAADKVVEEDLFFRSERQQRTLAENAAEVGEAVVKIESSSGQGSGFLTTPDGYIVTNNHVVEGETEVAVTLFIKSRSGFDLKTVRACKVIALNPHVDLALIKMTPPAGMRLKHVFLGDSQKVRVGERVFAIGTPIGLERTVSSGIISVTNRAWSGFNHFQMTTPINPGNSGGPLFNLRGEVVGVNSSGYLGAQGLNFAIPSKYVMDFLRNRDAFALNASRNENGVKYLPGPRKPKPAKK